MATLVLTAVGSLVGGPIGSAIGAVIGQQIDNAVLAGPAREGPRLKELDVQTSSYGSQIPAVFGAMRVAGTVIWSTDLIEHRSKNGNGKGKPSTIDYSYSVSFAVALSSRPTLRVGRIWADGNLLRGEAGDFKVDTRFRFYNGHADQTVDPLMASADADSPAYRGISYAMFEDLQLAEFGNRIPSLTFELLERDTPVPVADIVSAASYERIHSVSQETVGGFALQGADGRSALASILSITPTLVRTKEGQLELSDWSSEKFGDIPVVVAGSLNHKQSDRPSCQREPQDVVSAFAIRYYEPARDYQIGIQRSQMIDTGRTTRQLDLPATISAPEARRFADLLMLKAQKSQTVWSGQIVTGESRIHVGDYIVAANLPGKWQVVAVEQMGMGAKLSARMAVQQGVARWLSAEPGRNVTPSDLEIGSSVLMLLELPAPLASDPARALIVVAATGLSPGWRRAALSLQTGQGLVELGATAGQATIGTIVGSLPAHPANLTDVHNSVVMELLNPAAELDSGDIPLSDNSVPIFWIGRELFRAGKIDFLGDRRYRLSHLQRSCFGSEHPAAGHPPGENIVLVQPESLRILDSGHVSIGAQITVEALGTGDSLPVTASLVVTGEAIRPLSPVHGRITHLMDGGLDLDWVRRNRVDFGWLDNVDQPLSEDSEAYLVELRDGQTLISSWQTTEPKLAISAAEISARVNTNASLLHFDISQFGRFARSTPMRIDWLR